MPEACLVSAAYPQAPHRVRQFAESVLAACEPVGAGVVMVTEAGYEPVEMLGILRPHLDVTLVSTDIVSQPARLRQAMLSAARNCAAEVLVFLDYDDVAFPDLVSGHLANLSDSDAELSYCDLRLMTDEGEFLDRCLFSDSDWPDRVAEPQQLADGNFLGFSNTALRRMALRAEDCLVPEQAVACDWWLFTTLVAHGVRGQRIPEALAAYRQHPQNILGDDSSLDVYGLQRRLTAAKIHFHSFPDAAWASERLGWVEDLERALLLDRSLVRQVRGEGKWFSGLLSFASHIRESSGHEIHH